MVQEADIVVKQESTTPTVMTPSESAVVVPDLTSDSPMDVDETEPVDMKDTQETEIKKEPTPSISNLDSARTHLSDDNPPSPKSTGGTPAPEILAALNNDRQSTPEPRTPGSTPGSISGTATNSAETSPSRKLKRMLPPPERMVTRGVSGAIRHRSVDEILGTASERSPPSSGTRPLQQDRSSPTLNGSAATSPGPANDSFFPPTNTSTSTSNYNKLLQMKLHSTKKRPLPTTTPVMMKRSESKYGLQRYDDGQPMGRFRHVDLYAWQLKAQSQPLYKSLQTASKALTTKDWKIAREELKLMRAMQRIEALKAGNRWSFKQIKKHRGPPRTLAHWDHLLDEMKWTQVDFKEERRWKIATAYQVSRWIMAYHQAEDKKALCVSTRKVIERSMETLQTQDEVEAPAEKEETKVEVEDYLNATMFDASEAPQETSTVASIDLKEVNSKLESPEENKEQAPDGVSVKQEAIDTPLSQLVSQPSEEPSADANKPGPSGGDASQVEEDSKAGIVGKLKENAKDELMMPPPISPAVIQRCRPSILELDPNATMFSLEILEPYLDGTELGSLDINALFPDLPLYDAPNPDDNEPYVDEAEQGRVTMISRLMSSRPPALDFGPLSSQVVYLKRKRDLSHVDMEMDDFDEEDARIIKIEAKPLNAIAGTEPPRIVPALFQPRKNKDAPTTPIRRPTPPGAQALKNVVVWTADEEDLVMSLIKPYQYNWDLIAELYNAMRGPMIPSERRTSWDCYEKWAKKEGPQSSQNSASTESGSGLIPIGNMPSGSGSAPTSPKARKDKDGKKVMATIKIDATKKKQRSLSLMEAMKKAAKKREIAQGRVNAGKLLR